jgi:hypothetical protein
MTTQKDLECEMEELRLEIKDNAERIDKLCNLLKQNNTKLRTLKGMTNDTKSGNCTKITSTYPIDDEIVIINGEKYKRIIEEPKKPQTLHKTLLQKTEIYPKVCGEICDVVRGWLIDHTVIETEDEEMITFTIHKEQLQTPK